MLTVVSIPFEKGLFGKLCTNSPQTLLNKLLCAVFSLLYVLMSKTMKLNPL